MLERPDFKEIVRSAVRGASTKPTGHTVRDLTAAEGFGFVPIDLIEPDPNQPRQHFDAASLADLTASVKEKGVLQPVLARKEAGSKKFILIAGERRWRAGKAAGLREIPALIRGERDAFEVALIENLQRENL